MPITYANAPSDGQSDFASDESLLVNESGRFTQEAELIHQFISECDYTQLFEEDDLDDLIYVSEGWFVEGDDGDLYEADESTPGAEWTVVEAMDGEAAAHLIDMDDMLGMFASYVRDLSENSLESRLLKQVGERMLAGNANNDVSEREWNRGIFKRIYRKRQGPDMVNRMLGAMLAKQVLKRKNGEMLNQPGTSTYTLNKFTGKYGFTVPSRGSGGKYMRGPGYPSGTEKGLKGYREVRSGSKYKKQNAAFRKELKKILNDPSFRAEMAQAGQRVDPKTGKKLTGDALLKAKKATNRLISRKVKAYMASDAGKALRARQAKARAARAKERAAAAQAKWDAEHPKPKREVKSATRVVSKKTVKSPKPRKPVTTPARPVQNIPLKGLPSATTQKGPAREVAKEKAKQAAARNGKPIAGVTRRQLRKAPKSKRVNASLDYISANINESAMQDQLRVAAILEGLAPIDPLLEASDVDDEDEEYEDDADESYDDDDIENADDEDEDEEDYEDEDEEEEEEEDEDE